MVHGMKKSDLLTGFALFVVLVSSPTAGAAQAENGEFATQTPRAASLPSVFIDCNGPSCDQNYYRTEIAWVNWVRDTQVSDVHVIITSQQTGAGGREYQLDFSGRDRFSEYSDKVVLRTLFSDTDRERLDAVAHTLSVGLARFAAANGYRGIVQLTGSEAPTTGRGAGAGRVVSAEQVSDPWNLWTFRVGANGFVNGQQTQSTINVSANMNASRVTPSWRVSYGGNVNYNRQERELSNNRTFLNEQTNFGFNALMVNSVAGHWSTGFRFQTQRATSFNQNLQVSLRPALEYSYFPYEDATRRAFTAMYEIGPQYRNYMEETIFGFTEQTVVEHSLEVEFSQRQTWGNAGLSASASQFLHDMDRYSYGLSGNVDFRIFRGLSVNSSANWQKTNDQIYLSNNGITDEEALLGLRQRASSFNYRFNMGLSYQFGSVFNNVVNNRFGGGGGGGGGGGFGGGGGGMPGGGGGGRGGM